MNAWRTALTNAARAGAVKADSDNDAGSHSTQQQHRGHLGLLALPSGQHLLQLLESSEWGRPLGLEAVIVCVADILSYTRCSIMSGTKVLTF